MILERLLLLEREVLREKGRRSRHNHTFIYFHKRKVGLETNCHPEPRDKKTMPE